MSDFPELDQWYRAKQLIDESHEGERAYWQAVEDLERAYRRRMKLSQTLNAKDGE